MNTDIYEVQKIMEAELPKKRFYHTLGVAHTAVCLAMRYKEDYKKAQLAGLLHDCAKCIPDQEILEICRSAGIPVSEAEYKSPYLLHGKLGAYYSKTRFGIEDEDILNSITYHTTGRPAMSLLEKIIFLADYIEPGRKEIPGLSQIRDTAFENLDKGICLALNNTLDYLKNQKNSELQIDNMSQNAYNYYKDKCWEIHADR